MGKSAPSPPPPPDPTTVANAQAAANKDTAYATAQLNRVNQTTPYGDVTWSNSLGNIDTIPGAAATDNSDATPASYKIGDQTFGSLTDAQNFLNQNGTWTQTTTLTPDQQKALGSQQSLTQSLYDLANQQSGRISSTLATPLSFDNLPTMATGLDSSKIASLPTGVDASHLPAQISGLDSSSLPAMPNSPQDVNNQVTQAMYGQATSRLDPQWQESEQRLNDQLAQQGIPVGSDAYNKAMGDFSRAKNDAYTSALNSSIVSGAQQGSTDYGLALQGVQTGVGTQVANAGLANQAGQFGLAEQGLNSQIADQAAQEQIQQQMDSAQLAQAARQQGISESTYLYNQPLNEAIALMGGGQVQGPQAAAAPQVSMAPTDVTGAYGLAQQGQLAAYQAQVANQSANTGALGGIAGAGIGAAGLYFF